MSEREQKKLEAEVIEPPESDGGSGAAALSSTEIKPVDQPEGNGGTGGGGKITPINQ
ncbi:MAG: hypothetical protein LC794_13830 [Acidobacteria bacterium]|nr:hypothetical protein [Acidobacteriota bacterium]MCA1627753.1 hypothetical protein [Acidobacteriota bacterium]